MLSGLKSTDETTLPQNRKFLIQVEPTLQSLLSQEDKDGNMQITIEDNGPKVQPPLKRYRFRPVDLPSPIQHPKLTHELCRS